MKKIRQFLLLLWLLSKIGIIHTTGETNAQATVNKAMKYLDSIGMAYADHTIDDVSVIQETINMMRDEGCQAVFVANDNKLASHGNMAILGGACLENGLPLYCAAFKEGENLSLRSKKNCNNEACFFCLFRVYTNPEPYLYTGTMPGELLLQLYQRFRQRYIPVRGR